MKILAIAETYNFKNYTRRATFEAIGEVKELKYLVLNNFIKKRKITSDFESDKIIELKTFFPRSSIFFRIEEYLFKRFYIKKVLPYDVVIITSPNQWFLADLIPKNILLIFLVSDPFHLMNNIENVKIKERIQVVLNRADLVLTTSLNIKEIYLRKYFSFYKDNVYYWPNCVDLKIWSYDNFSKLDLTKSDKKNIGFAGNFMNITDVELLDFITTELPEQSFRIAGKISYSPHEEKLNKIFSKKNVEYLNVIPYEELQMEVSSWDVCLLLDAQSEFASFHHHNKIYQYLALGKPVVLLDYLKDYEKFKDKVYIAKNEFEFLSYIMVALKEINKNILSIERVKIASQNSSIQRANDFFTILEKYFDFKQGNKR